MGHLILHLQKLFPNYTPVGKLLPTDFLFSQINSMKNLPIPIPIRNYVELISLTDTDSLSPPSGDPSPQKITDR